MVIIMGRKSTLRVRLEAFKSMEHHRCFRLLGLVARFFLSYLIISGRKLGSVKIVVGWPSSPWWLFKLISEDICVYKWSS